MKPLDKDLAFMLRYENVAWYEDGRVKILDRRIYPREISYVECKNHEEVAKAINDMVTQSGGPFLAAGMGMALAAYESQDKKEKGFLNYMKEAAYRLSHARPTTSEKMVNIVEEMYQVAKKASKEGVKADEAILKRVVANTNKKYERISRTAEFLVNTFPEKGAVMTQCFGETVVGFMVKKAKEQNKEIKYYCPETRPYLQGARLTASVIKDMGGDVTVITDNMPGFVLKKKNIDVFTSAADIITVDGHVINKIGTFQIALAANYYGVPYFVTGEPDSKHPDTCSVEIEERDSKFVLEAMGRKTTMEGVEGYYPAFDITPPSMVNGVVTEKGIYSAFDLKSYFI
ncbi:MAG: s-methyl-5-thioribose-1-phosphate isomerase [Tissierellales bacterium]|nr:s-methyl-5-thioribose-1-phosphate isomerase [Tissierellales bacterium]